MSGRTSQNTGRAPRSTNAFAVDTNVNDGTITSSPGWMSSSSAAISSACVQEVVSSAARRAEHRCSSSWHRVVKVWSPAICPMVIVSKMYSSSRPSRDERLKGIWVTGYLLFIVSRPLRE